MLNFEIFSESVAKKYLVKKKIECFSALLENDLLKKVLPTDSTNFYGITTKRLLKISRDEKAEEMESYE